MKIILKIIYNKKYVYIRHPYNYFIKYKFILTLIYQITILHLEFNVRVYKKYKYNLYYNNIKLNI